MFKSQIKLRVATSDDVDVIADFAVTLAEEAEGMKLDKELVKQGVLHCIQNPKLGRHFVAWIESDPEKKLIGTAQVTY